MAFLKHKNNKWNDDAISLVQDVCLHKNTQKTILNEIAFNFGTHSGPSKLKLISSEPRVFSEAGSYNVISNANSQTKEDTQPWRKRFTLPPLPTSYKTYKPDDSFMANKMPVIGNTLRYHNGKPTLVRSVQLQADPDFTGLFALETPNDRNVSWLDSAVNYVVDAFRSIASASTLMVRNIVTHVWNWMRDNLTSWFPQFSQFANILQAFLSHFSFSILMLVLKMIGVSDRIMLIALGVYTALMAKSVPIRILGAVAAIGAIYTKPAAEVNVTVNNTYPEVRQANLQASVFNVELVNKLVAIAFGAVLINYIPNDTIWDKLLLRADRLPKAVTGMLNLAHHVEELYGNIARGAKELVGCDPDIGFALPVDLELNFKEVLELSKGANVAKIATDAAIRERVQSAYYNYFNLRRTYHTNAELRTLLDKYQTPIINLMKKATDHTVGATETRQKPVLSLFRGGTGVGKSELLHYLAADLLTDMSIITREMSDEEIVNKVNTSVFSRQVETEYWDTYNNQPICLYDDFGQMVDSTSNPNLEFMEFIRAANRFPMTLHMAELSQKNVTFFTSRHMIATTNLSSIHPVSLISPDAVQSRVDFAFQVTVAPEYQVDSQSTHEIDHRIDRNKLPRDDNGAPVNGVYVYRFQKWDVTRNVVSPDFLNYEQVVAMLCAQQRSYEIGHRRTDEAIVSHVRRVTPQALPEWLTNWWNDGMAAARTAFVRARELAEQRASHPIFRFLNMTEIVMIIGALVAALAYRLSSRDAIPCEELWHTSLILDMSFCIVTGYCSSPKIVASWLVEPPDYLNPRAVELAYMYLVMYSIQGKKVEPEVPWEECWAHFQFDSMKDLVAGNGNLLRMEAAFRELLHQQTHGSRVTQLTNAVMSTLVSATMRLGIRTLLEGHKKVWQKRDQGMMEVLNESGRNDRKQKSVRLEEQEIRGETSLESGRNDRRQKSVKLEKEAVKLESFKSGQSGEVTRMLRKSYAVAHSTVPMFGVTGRWYTMNRHYYHLLPDEFIVRTVGCTSGIVVKRSELEVHNFSRDSEGDVIAVRLPRRFPLVRDMTKHFITKSQLKALVTRDVVLVVPPHTESSSWTEKHGKVIQVTTEPLQMNSDVRRVTYFETSVRSVDGDCGGVYVVDSNDLTNKLVGIHFAGTNEGGAMACPLTQEDLAELAVELAMDVPKVVTDGSNEMRHAIPQGRVTVRPPASVNSSLLKTEIHGKVQESTVLPAELGPITGESGKRGLAKVGGDVPNISQELLEQATASYEARLTGVKENCRVLTFEEAVQGIEGSPYIRGINRSKSAGYPWSLESSKGKRKWFGSDEWKFGAEAEVVKQEVERKIENITRGRYEPSLYTDTLKDETRPIEKVLAGKTRVFAAASMDFVILFRMYFLGFLAFIMMNRVNNEVAVGINAHSPEWHKLAKNVTVHGKDRVIAGDFTDYDGTLHPDILWQVCEIANRWYDDGNDAIRRAIFEDVVHSWHVTGLEVNQWTHSQPSGNPGTAVVNSIYNSIAMRIAYCNETGLPMHTFNENIAMVSYGDDNLLNVSAKVDIDQAGFTRGLATIGMKYTSEDKSEACSFRSINDVRFLKRGFRFEPNIGLWVAPLVCNSINERLNWQHRVPNPRETLMQSVEGAIVEWSLHDDETFKYWTKKIRSAIREIGFAPEIYSRQYYLAMIRDSSLADSFPHLTYV